MQIGCLPYFHTWCGLSANSNLRCRSETCCMRVAENTGRKKGAKNRYLGTIAQLCRAISSQLKHVSTIGKNIKQQYLLYMSSRYGELWPTIAAKIGLPVWGTPANFNGFRVLASSACQPNFAALNRGRHICSAGRPSRWELAHSLVYA